MKSYRIFVEKYPEFRVEAESLLRDLNANLNLSLDGLRLLNVYDLFGFSDELLEKSRYRVFGEVVTDAVTDSCDLGGNSFLAVECLPGQFDQRAASAVDCVRLIDPSAEVKIKSSKLLIFPSKLPKETMERIRRYYINAVESREKDLRVLDDLESAPVKPVPVLDGFREMEDAELDAYCKKNGLAMNADDLLRKLCVYVYPLKTVSVFCLELQSSDSSSDSSLKSSPPSNITLIDLSISIELARFLSISSLSAAIL